jgi:hypothetical protein
VSSRFLIKPVIFMLGYLAIMVSCDSAKPGWKALDLGRYLIDVPETFHFQPMPGIDSRPGMITDGKIRLYTDYGYFTDTLYQTPQEYLSKKYFIYDTMYMFMKQGVTYDMNHYPKIEVLSIRPTTVKDSDKFHFLGGSDYVATCRHDKTVFKWAVKLPPDIKHHTVQIDTFNHTYRRIAIPKKGYQGRTAIYLRDKRSFNKSINNYHGIVISTDSLSDKQQKLVLEMYNTLRLKD